MAAAEVHILKALGWKGQGLVAGAMSSDTDEKDSDAGGS